MEYHTLYNYTSIAFCIRNKVNSPLPMLNAIVYNDTLPNLHKNLLVHCHNEGYMDALIYENDIHFHKDIRFINNEEIERFILKQSDWDVLIIGTNSLIGTCGASPVNGFSTIVKLNASDIWFTEFVYIASYRLMQKLFDNKNDVQFNTYVYVDNFCKNVDKHDNSDEYIICEIDNFSCQKPVRYTWHPIKIHTQ